MQFWVASIFSFFCSVTSSAKPSLSGDSHLSGEPTSLKKSTSLLQKNHFSHSYHSLFIGFFTLHSLATLSVFTRRSLATLSVFACHSLAKFTGCVAPHPRPPLTAFSFLRHASFSHPRPPLTGLRRTHVQLTALAARCLCWSSPLARAFSLRQFKSFF